MKLFSAEQLRQWDEYTIREEPVSSLDLMERAALQCTEWIIAHQLYEFPISIFCGKGNNGGDGLAIARQLIQREVQVAVYILEFGHKGSADFQANLQRLHKVTKEIFFLQAESSFPPLSSTDLVIDALFGSGLNRPLDQFSALLVDHINNSGASIISIDVPSGMFLDTSSQLNSVVRASNTLTFQVLKPCFLAAENSPYLGQTTVLDIGLHPAFADTATTKHYLTTLPDIRHIYQPRKQHAHKGDHGHALIIGGAEGKTGAAMLATEACIRAGAGLTSVHLLADNYTAIHARSPEAMTFAGDQMVKKNIERFNAIGIGPGLGQDDMALRIMSVLLDNFTGGLVIDADALNLLATQPSLLQQLPRRAVITPHPKEFDRLFGEHQDDISRWETAVMRAAALDVVIVLKGHHTLVTANGEAWFNTTGNAGLAKGGSGDTLTGIVTAQLAQGYQAFDAARLAVYLHGLAADLACNIESYETLSASDVTRYLGAAFKKLITNG